MEEKKKLIKQSKIMIAMALVIVFVLAGTYAWMMLSKTSTVVNKITAGTLDLVLDDSISDGIHLEKQVPMSFQQGLTTTPYTFKLINNATTPADYTISLEDFYEGVTIPTEGKFEDSKIRYILLKDDETPTGANSKLLSEGRNLTTGTIEGSTEVNYTLYMWIDSKAGIEVNNQIFSGRLNITAEQATQKYTVSGVYKDSTGTAVPNKQLVIYTPSGDQIKTTTDPEGKFTFDNVPSGVTPMYFVPDGVNPDGKTPTELEETPGVERTDVTIPTPSTDPIVFPSGASLVDVIFTINKGKNVSSNISSIDNIEVAYYSQDDQQKLYAEQNIGGYVCITGDEDSCLPTECYKDKTVGSCSPGTIIKYRVNDNDLRVFHVLHDDGDTITMQERENTVNLTTWYSSASNNTYGPTTALSNLIEATSDWTNVNDITYEMGTTELGSVNNKTAATTCTLSYSAMECSRMGYTMDRITAKARMITGQEATDAGCKYVSTSSTDTTCKVWMYTALKKSSVAQTPKTGRIVQDNFYWTMSSTFIKEGSSSNTKSAYAIAGTGNLRYLNVNQGTDPGSYGDAGIGARAVVEISK